jgi:hypothetical protein
MSASLIGRFGSSAFRLSIGAASMSLTGSRNAALSTRGGSPLENADADSTFKAHLSAAAQTMRSLLAVLVARRPDLGTFKSLSDQIDSLPCLKNFKTTLWDVNFSRALSVGAPLFKQWQATPADMAAIQEATSADDLADRLEAVGVDVALDPIELARDNRERLRRVLIRL